MGEVDERYKRGIIYTIRNITDDTMIYVGSTINTLPKRFYKHKCDCKLGINYSLYNYIENNDWGNWYMEWYEDFPCNNKKELCRREGEVIREIGTINKCIAGRTRKEWREDNAEKTKEADKKWSENNAKKVKDYKKKWSENNAEKVKEKNSESVCCEICGAFSTRTNLKRHQQSKKCRSVLN
jgi:hypothetical protein